jgi:hypothetical protein
MAHLTIKRKKGTPPDKAWDPGLLTDLHAPMKELRAKADPARIGKRALAAVDAFISTEFGAATASPPTGATASGGVATGMAQPSSAKP